MPPRKKFKGWSFLQEKLPPSMPWDKMSKLTIEFRPPLPMDTPPSLPWGHGHKTCPSCGPGHDCYQCDSCITREAYIREQGLDR